MAQFEKTFHSGAESVAYSNLPQTSRKDETKSTISMIPRTLVRMIKFNFRFNKRGISLLILFFIFCGIVLWVITQPKEGYIRGVDVFVLEENHEVLQYWYALGTSKVIKKTGNTLIKIDAHGDMAPPVLTREFPFFTWPKNKMEVFELMQHEGVTVSAAAATGLIDEFIWIHPTLNTTLPLKKITALWSIGHLAKSNSVCECLTPYNDNGVLLEAEEKCGYIDIMAGEEVELDKKSCDIKRTLKTIHMPGNIAVNELEKETLLDPQKDILLDIDESYFGWDNGLKALEDVGISATESKRIHQIVKKMMCTKSVQHEQKADRVLKEYIMGLMKACKLETTESSCKTDMYQLQKEMDPLMENNFKREPFMFCAKGMSQNLRYGRELLGILRQFNYNQLEAIIQLGFCMRSSTSHTDFNPMLNNFGLCFGKSVFNSNFTEPEQTPTTKEEMIKKMYEFYTMMDHIVHMNVMMISVVRSVRNGNTPRSLANLIEELILEYFRMEAALGDVDYYVNFDRNLLGGAMGWQGRFLHRHKQKPKKQS